MAGVFTVRLGLEHAKAQVVGYEVAAGARDVYARIPLNDPANRNVAGSIVEALVIHALGIAAHELARVLAAFSVPFAVGARSRVTVSSEVAFAVEIAGAVVFALAGEIAVLRCFAVLVGSATWRGGRETHRFALVVEKLCVAGTAAVDLTGCRPLVRAGLGLVAQVFAFHRFATDASAGSIAADLARVKVVPVLRAEVRGEPISRAGVGAMGEAKAAVASAGVQKVWFTHPEVGATAGSITRALQPDIFVCRRAALETLIHSGEK